RTTEPLVVAIVCCVQIPIAETPGSATAAACVSRASEVSTLSVVPGWGRLAGTLYDGTVTLASWNRAYVDAEVPVILSIRSFVDGRTPSLATMYPAVETPNRLA